MAGGELDTIVVAGGFIFVGNVFSLEVLCSILSDWGVNVVPNTTVENLGLYSWSNIWSNWTNCESSGSEAKDSGDG
jgi:hypothetical protein